MFLTIILVPMMYYIVDRITDKIKGRKAKKDELVEELI